MFDDKTESAKRAIEEYGKKGVRAGLLKIAMLSTRNAASAKDLVQDAFLRLLDVEDMPWTTGSFLKHMSFAMRNTWDDQLRRFSASERPDEEVTAGDKSYAEDEAQDEVAGAREELDVQRVLGQRLVAALRDKHPIAARVFEHECDGVDEPAEQARLLGCGVEEVYRAKETLKRVGRQIREEWELSEEKRMAAARRKRQDNERGIEREDEP
jgi:DNA-directed RNA polymerase specialized sigma24 family protein